MSLKVGSQSCDPGSLLSSPCKLTRSFVAPEICSFWVSNCNSNSSRLSTSSCRVDVMSILLFLAASTRSSIFFTISCCCWGLTKEVERSPLVGLGKESSVGCWPLFLPPIASEILGVFELTESFSDSELLSLSLGSFFLSVWLGFGPGFALSFGFSAWFSSLFYVGPSGIQKCQWPPSVLKSVLAGCEVLKVLLPFLRVPNAYSQANDRSPPFAEPRGCLFLVGRFESLYNV